MKEVRRYNRRATDHRRAVLESIITHPTTPLMEGIVADARGADFTPRMIESMVWQLVHEGLVGWREDDGGYFVTRAGLEYFERASFDLSIPKSHTRPGARKPRRKRSTNA
jgi:predicted transcriptional regulator